MRYFLIEGCFVLVAEGEMNNLDNPADNSNNVTT